MPRILAVDNETRMCKIIKTSLELETHTVDMAFSGQEAIDKIAQHQYDVVISDLKMEPVNGMAVLEFAQKTQPQCDVIIMTAFATQDTALEAMKKGANDYLIKPFKMDELSLRIERIVKQKVLEQENRQLRQSKQLPQTMPGIIGKSAKMRAVFQKIQHVSDTDTAIQIRGESGTGKDLVAKAIHENSRRKDKSFLTINCAALPDNLLESELFGYEKGAFSGAHQQKKGLFEMAEGGTIFLDEIGDLPLSLQAKLLRVLQNNEIIHLGGTKPIRVDFRLITATHRDLEEMVDSQEFRSDLYYRINVYPIILPPLRERKEDIPELIQYFMGEYSNKTLTSEVRLKLIEYHFPGNIRELQNILARAVIGPDNVIDSIDIPEASNNQLSFPDIIPEEGINLDDWEKRIILAAVKQANGNKTKAAELLGITRRRLYSRMQRFGIELT